MEDGHHDLERVHRLALGVLLRRVWAYRDAAAVVRDRDLVVRMDPDIDAVARAVHRLVDRVVDDLAHEVVQTPEVGRPDVHAGPAANGLEALQDLNVLRAVRTAPLVRVAGRRFSHCHGYDFPALVRSS